MINFYRDDEIGIIEIPEWENNCWINSQLPDEKEKDFLFNKIKMPQAFFNDIEDIDERPRLEQEDGWLFVILRIPVIDNKQDIPFITVPLGIIFKDNVFVTISFHKNEIVNDFLRYSNLKKLSLKNKYELILRLFISSSVWYSKYLRQINKTVTLTEDKLEKSIKNEQLQELFSLEKTLIYFTTTLADHTFLLKRLKVINNLKDKTPTDLLEDVEIELMQAQTTAQIVFGILRRSEESYNSILSNNLNKVMKHLTSISIILMIPTLIASFYGMNVPNSLENNPFAFVLLFLVSIIIASIGFIIFKKIDWF